MRYHSPINHEPQLVAVYRKTVRVPRSPGIIGPGGERLAVASVVAQSPQNLAGKPRQRMGYTFRL